MFDFILEVSNSFVLVRDFYNLSKKDKVIPGVLKITLTLDVLVLLITNDLEDEVIDAGANDKDL